ncbi:hypothetical protein BU26DRAFT_162416 [Trematosphaeria pertusa]|uniref:ELYS-like domain-containing protein n=1 Tax=Trematosphaeria pertusa TaxID=390896 RepID=A0A6A6HW30_9PLEO|nr:uncharacterized protein BU26DRAFT_162416 [Trematosphaeria pertusa]KAF2241968.1 hypothetical protein BU26DRAFT_162416 [Trematosphaeria pertusa]
MLDIEEYEDVFPEGGYPASLVDSIQESQMQLGGRTFFERLLELLQIKWRRIYPPQDEPKLRELHKRIVEAPITLHYKHCLIFYLLKDLAPVFHEQPDLATQFAEDVHLEKRFWTFIEGIWELDHLQFETAVGNLTHPSILPTFPDEILLALLGRRNKMPGSVSARDILPLAYYNCAKPPLVGEHVQTEFARYMAARNVTEAYYWIRTRPEHEHHALLEVMVDQTLQRRDRADYDAHELYPAEDRVMELVGLPFSEEEDEWIEKFLTEGKGRTFRQAEDTVVMRRIATGRVRDVAREKGHKGRKYEGVNWEILRDGMAKGLGPRRDEEAFAV